jgi:geranylgeranyl reductase family protein
MDADVIIVGAGPAGSTCARLLGRERHSVLLLDEGTFPRDKPCGGWVNAKAFKEFAALEAARTKGGAKNRLVEEALHGLVFLSPDLSSEAVYRSRRAVGYTVLRKQFDAKLVEMARKAGRGVKVVQRQKIVAVEPGEQGVVVTNSRGKSYSGSILVGADGAMSAVARLSGLRDRWPRERRVVCLADEIPVDARTLTRLYGKQRRIHICIGYRGMAGTAWALPKRNTVAVGVGCPDDASDRLRESYDQWVEDLKVRELLPAKASSKRPNSGMVPAGGAIDYEGHVGKRTLLIGDAGGFVSAVSGEGIYPGMLSADVAATCIGEALKSPHPQDALNEFKVAWRRRFAEYVQMPNANLSLLLPLIYDNAELCNRLAECYLFGKNF